MLNAGLGYFPPLDGEVDETTLRAFLAEQVPESQILDYKAEITAKKAAATVAAFANRNGGYLVLGVPEVKSGLRTVPGEPVGLSPTSESSFRTQCLDVLDPPWAPDIETCHLTTGKVVLIVRVPPLSVNRPVLIDGKVWTREGDQTRGASRETARMLFSEADSGATRGENPANLAGQQGPPLAPHLRKRDWFAVRGVVTSPTPIGSRPVVLDHQLRRRLFDRISHGRANAWLGTASEEWNCVLEPWKYLGEASSFRFEVGRTSGWPDHSLLGLSVRITYGVGSSVHNPPGIWCYVDLAFSTSNRARVRLRSSTGANASLPDGEMVSFSYMSEMIASALSQADTIAAALAAEFPEPRPRFGSACASLHGWVSHVVDFRDQGDFSRNVDDITERGWSLSEPRTNSRLGKLDPETVTRVLIDRFLLDAGQVEKLPLSAPESSDHAGEARSAPEPPVDAK